MRGLNNEIKDAFALSDNVLQQFQKFVAFLQQLNNQIATQETEKKGKAGPWNSSTTPHVPHTTHAPSTATGTGLGPMNPSVNQRTLTSKECQQQILEGRCLYCGGFGHVVLACPNKCPYGSQLFRNEAHVAPF
jgi:hypothetical protein